MKHLFLVLALALTSACATTPTPKPVESTILPPIVIEAPESMPKLSWELPTNDGQVYQGSMPERAAWSEHLYNELEKHYNLLMTAKDIKTIIPNFDIRTKRQRLVILSELMSTVTEYESSWNPKTVAKDTNGLSGEKYKARGLCQMNAALDKYGDQKNYRTGTTYNYTQLEDPFINLEVCVKILATVVDVRGKITFSKNEKSPVLRFFFATLVTDTSYGAKTLAAAHKRIAVLDKAM